MRALLAIGLAALLAAWVGAFFPHPRSSRAWHGEIVRTSAADEVDRPPAPGVPEPADDAARDAPIAVLQVAPTPPAPAAATAEAGGDGVRYNVAEGLNVIARKVDAVVAEAKKQEAASPPHPAEVAEETKESVVPLATDVPPPLQIPVVGIEANALHDTFTEARAGGARPHDAIDIMAPAGTPVVAVDDGRIVKLFLSERGGITAYQFDASERFVYYYAHLQAYAPGLEEGRLVKRGEPIGIVGSTGNANPAAPHLHFAVMVLGPEKRWWEAAAINPYPLLIAPEGKLAGE